MLELPGGIQQVLIQATRTKEPTTSGMLLDDIEIALCSDISKILIYVGYTDIIYFVLYIIKLIYWP